MAYIIDTETVSLTGPVVLIQYAKDDGEIVLHHVWSETAESTMKLIEAFVEEGIIGFNLSFDWFQISKLYTILDLFPDKTIIPKYFIKEFAAFEPFGRNGLCLKPRAACDLMLHARRGEYQSVMARGDIKIRRVPTLLAEKLVQELDKRVKLKNIYFAKRKEKVNSNWKITDTNDPEFKTIVLSFRASSALKALAADALGIETTVKYEEIELNKHYHPNEYGFAPFAQAVIDSKGKFGRASKGKKAKLITWVDVIEKHIAHWRFNEKAKEYARDDIVYTRGLYNYFGKPKLGDTDSELACMVGAIRWKGYKIDIPGLKEIREEAVKKTKKKIEGKEWTIPTAFKETQKYILPTLSEMEAEKFQSDSSTNLKVLTTISKWVDDCDCVTLLADPECKKCKGTGEVPHKAAKRAREVIEARKANWAIDLYDKLLLAGRFQPSFSVIGTLSSRMGGGSSAKGIESGGKAKGDRLNPQGIKRTEDVRSKFPLAFDDMILCAGDFDGFELTLAQAAYLDKQMEIDLLSGVSVHALVGEQLFPGKTYEEINKTKKKQIDLYDMSKRTVFAVLYGGNSETILNKVLIPAGIGTIEDAERAYHFFLNRYPTVAKKRQEIVEMFCSMSQPYGLGKQVVWKEPADYIESSFGFKRYFTLENQIVKALYELANDPPKEWKDLKIKVQRDKRNPDRIQLISGATQSALFGAAFGLQAANTRAAVNHVIQSAGATTTKHLQRKIWDVQPYGIGPWKVVPFQVHDEVVCPCVPEVVDVVENVVKETIEELKKKVPCASMTWKKNMKNWSEK